MNITEFIARIRFIAWIGFQIASKQPYNIEMTVDQKDALIDGVKFALAHPQMTPEENHKNWMQMKYKQGWKYGAEKSLEAKTHPDLVPFSELPEVEQLKDTMDQIINTEAIKLYNLLFQEGGALNAEEKYIQRDSL